MREHKSLFPFPEEIYEYVGSINTQILFSLCGITFPSPDYEIMRKNPNTYSIEYVYSGEGVIQENDQIYKVSAGDFFILHPHKYHHYLSNPNNPWKKIFITTDGNTEFITKLLSMYQIENQILFKKINSPLQLEKIFELFKSSRTNITRDLEILVFSMISDLSYLKTTSQHQNFIFVAKDFINKRINTRITVEEVSRYVNLNYSYFSRAFTKSEGISPNRYITQQKMLYAQKMLTETNLTIPQIANLLSYPDTSYFSNVFKSFFGITASDYKTKMLNK